MSDENRDQITYRSRSGKRVRIDGDSLAYYNSVHFLNKGGRVRGVTTGDAVAVSNSADGELRFKGILEALPDGAAIGDLIAWNGSAWVPGSAVVNTLPNGGSLGDLLYWNGAAWVSAIYSLGHSDTGKTLAYQHLVGWLPVDPFTIHGTPSNFDMVYWDGTKWQVLPLGAGPTADNYVLTYQHGGTSLQLRPIPTQIADGTSNNSLLRWNGSAWVELALNPGAPEDGHVLTWNNSGGTYELAVQDGMPAASSNGQLTFYNGSSWTVTGAPPTGSILYWNGTSWNSPSGNPNTGAILTYAAGAWKYANNGGSIPIASFLTWNGSDWAPVSGLNADQFVYPTSGGSWGSAPALADGQVYQKNGALGFKTSSLGAVNSLVYYDGSSTKTLRTIADTIQYDAFLYWHPNTSEYKYSQSPRDGSVTGMVQPYFYNDHGTPANNHWYMTDVANSPGDFFHRGNGNTMGSSDMPALTGGDFITWHAGDYKWKATSGMGSLTAGSFAYRSNVHTGGWNGAQPPGPYKTAFWDGVNWQWKPQYYGSITYTALYGDAQSTQAVAIGQMYYWNGAGLVTTTLAPINQGIYVWNGSQWVNLPPPPNAGIHVYGSASGHYFLQNPVDSGYTSLYPYFHRNANVYTQAVKPIYQSWACWEPGATVTVYPISGRRLTTNAAVAPTDFGNSRSGATWSFDQGEIDITDNPSYSTTGSVVMSSAFEITGTATIAAQSIAGYRKWYLKAHLFHDAFNIVFTQTIGAVVITNTDTHTVTGTVRTDNLWPHTYSPTSVGLTLAHDDGVNNHGITLYSVNVYANWGTG